MSTIKLTIVKEKQQEINDFLKGYWENDIWSAYHPVFDEFRKTVWDRTYKKIDFSCFESKIKDEIKFFILNRLKVDDVRLYQTVIRRYAASFKHVADLLNQYYPYINSIIDVDLNKAMIQLRSMLVKKGLKIRRDGSLTKYETFLKVIYLFYKDFYDERDNFEKDIWDIRKIAKSKVVEHEAQFRINDSGKPVKIHPSDIENEDMIEWEYIRSNLDAVRMPLGYCTKPIKQPCPTQSDPCLSCRNLCTTPEFTEEYERQIRDTEAVIERGKAINRPVWIEKNQEKLDRLKPIYEILKQGKIHHKAGKKGREYSREDFSEHEHK
ncbi:hypothetical protein [Bacillus mycoides]|uniref:hypothetical protein n=1 Tax=Bacillus mycoides TaxID=1405 RepID=UPI003558E52A